MSQSGNLSDVAAKLDFSIGEDFEQEVRRRFGSQVHHDSPSTRGSFLLLATFRRSLIRLSEESVALVLESCLGGHAPFFHVKEVSHNHFQFSVSCKPVGFHIYKLRRVIGTVFYVYFHLWSNGAPYWEREKRLWEEEEARQWSLVLSKNQKRAAKEASQKKVRFAHPLICSPRKFKSVPPEIKSSVRIGAFELTLSAGSCDHQVSSGYGILKKDFLSDSDVMISNSGFQLDSGSAALNDDFVLGANSQIPRNSPSEVSVALHQSLTPQDQVQNDSIGLSNSENSLASSADASCQSFTARDFVRRVRRLGGCTRCLNLSHICFDCDSEVRCAVCFNYGHKSKFCFTKSQTKLCWRPKRPTDLEFTEHGGQPTRDTEGSGAYCDSPSSRGFIHIDRSARLPGSHSSEPVPLPHSTPLPWLDDQGDEDMANFVVHPAPFVPAGLEVEDWARPARGRIVVSGNPPRQHDEYAIITVLPPPHQNELYDTMEDVVQYFEHEQNVRAESSCLSPLGLCLVQFRFPVARQAMINLSPLQLDAMHEIVVVEHDQGLNLRSCPFTRTCWIMFLASPLDFQTREIISQAVGYFGTIITWTNNARCKSRILLRCKVTHISRILRSLIVCEGNVVGDNGSSWTIPIFVLTS